MDITGLRRRFNNYIHDEKVDASEKRKTYNQLKNRIQNANAGSVGTDTATKAAPVAQQAAPSAVPADVEGKVNSTPEGDAETKSAGRRLIARA